MKLIHLTLLVVLLCNLFANTEQSIRHRRVHRQEPAPSGDAPAGDTPAPSGDAPAGDTSAPSGDAPAGDTTAPSGDAPAGDTPAPSGEPEQPPQQKENKWFSLIKGAVEQINGGNVQAINDCIPESWKYTEDNAESSEATPAVQLSGTLASVISGLETVIGAVCQFKDTIKGLILQKYPNKKKIRLLLQRFNKPNTSSSKQNNTVKPATTTVKPTTTIVKPTNTTVKPTTITVKPTTTIVKPITNTVKPTTNTVKPTNNSGQPTNNTVKPTSNTVKPTNSSGRPNNNNGKPNQGPTRQREYSSKAKKQPRKVAPAPVKPASTFLDALKKVATAVLDKAKQVGNVLLGLWKKFVEAVRAFFASPIMTTIKDTFSCVGGLQDAAGGIADTFNKIVAKFENIINGGGSALADILIDMLCKFTDFKAAVDFFVAASRSTSTTDKWNNIGKGIGKLLYSIATSRRFHKLYKRLRMYKRRLLL